MKLQVKLSLGLSFLFVMIVLFGTLSIYYVNRLSIDSALVLKDNHESLVYCNNMLKALEDIPVNKNAITDFEENLKKQEKNITEIGEKEATQELRNNFIGLIADPSDTSNFHLLRESLLEINFLNQNAIMRKNEVAQKTAESAKVWLTAIFTLLIIISTSFVYNFPSVLSEPVRKLSEGIREIANKNYHKRIYLEQKDEFGDLANAFNSMAEKLDEYENSNLAQLRFEKSRIETIINQMKDGIIGLDDKKNILFLNAVAEKLLGLDEKEVTGKFAADIALRNDLMRTLLQDESKKEFKIYADNKESFFNKDSISVSTNGQIVGSVIVLRNITLFHELNEAKTNFIATISHELKTPISSIKMSAKLLTDARVGQLNDEQAELVKSIKDDSERLLKITGEVLNISQVETGNMQLKLQSTNVHNIVNRALDTVHLSAQQKRIYIKTEIADNLPQIRADEEKTSWVLINFLTNAVKYSSENTVVTIYVYQKNNAVEFVVVDHGKGIEEKYIAKIFNRYYKVPGINENNSSGLGLAISKEFIDAQNGHIWVDSKIGEGSTFGFSMPIA